MPMAYRFIIDLQLVLELAATEGKRLFILVLCYLRYQVEASYKERSITTVALNNSSL